MTTIQRNGSGVFTGIQAPRGQVTSATLDSNGWLNSITNPNSEIWNMTYVDAGGLMQTFQKPGGQTSTFGYDSLGNLTSDSSSSGSSFTLTLASPGVLNGATALGRTSNYTVSSTGITKIDPQGVTSSSSVATAGTPWTTTTSSRPDVSTSSTATYDPRYNAYGASGFYPSSSSVTTSQSSWSQTQSVSASGLTSYPFGYTSLTTTTTTNSHASTQVFTKSTGALVTTSSVGRVLTEARNTYGKETSRKWASYAPVTFSYDSYGRLNGATQSSRSSSISYNSNGFVSSLTNPASQTTSYTYDSAGRVLTETLPDSRVITYTYDSNGNLTSLTPPSTGATNFGINAFDLVSSDQPPALSGPTTTNTSYSYNNDRQLTQIDRPSGSSIVLHYGSSTGALDQIELPSSQTIDYTYSSGKLATAQSPDGIKNEFAYNGDQVKQDVLKLVSGPETLSTLALGHNNSFNVSSSVLTPASGSASTISFGYDNDDLLTAAGSETITRSSSTAFVTATTLSNIADSRSYDSTYGESSAYSATYTVTPTTLFSQSFTRDSLGRISTKSETVNGTTHTYAYTYDSAGRLTNVSRDSNSYSDYSYNSNSNRSSGHVAGTSFSATVDAQDRLTAYNNLTFSYNLNGERTSRTDTTLSLTTNYSYDALGRLKGVTLPNSDQIDYLVDGVGRRAGRRLNGTVTAYYVYEDQLRIGAVLTSAGAISQRFVYGTKPNVPDYMVSSGTTYRIISDERGSVRLVVNASSGSISQQIEYDEFGSVLSDSNPGFQPFGFAGCLYDGATQLCHFGAREYDAQVGRWLTKYPIGFGGGDTNLYGYVIQDPVNLIDPTGRNAVGPVIVVVVVVTGAVIVLIDAIDDYFHPTHDAPDPRLNVDPNRNRQNGPNRDKQNKDDKVCSARGLMRIRPSRGSYGIA